MVSIRYREWRRGAMAGFGGGKPVTHLMRSCERSETGTIRGSGTRASSCIVTSTPNGAWLWTRPRNDRSPIVSRCASIARQYSTSSGIRHSPIVMTKSTFGPAARSGSGPDRDAAPRGGKRRPRVRLKSCGRRSNRKGSIALCPAPMTVSLPSETSPWSAGNWWCRIASSSKRASEVETIRLQDNFAFRAYLGKHGPHNGAKRKAGPPGARTCVSAPRGECGGGP